MLGWKREETDAAKTLCRSTAFDTAVHFKADKLGTKMADSETFLRFADRVMSQRVYGLKFNLGLCIEESGIKIDVVQHRAMADVELTHALYKKISE